MMLLAVRLGMPEPLQARTTVPRSQRCSVWVRQAIATPRGWPGQGIGSAGTVERRPRGRTRLRAVPQPRRGGRRLGHGAEPGGRTVSLGEAAAVHPDEVARSIRSHCRSKFRGFGRCGTGDDGAYEFVVLKPAGVPTLDGDPQARTSRCRCVLPRHASARRHPSLLRRRGRGEQQAGPLLTELGPDRASTLVAHTTEGGYRFNVRFQDDPGDDVPRHS